jgi:hypothetical protein
MPGELGALPERTNQINRGPANPELLGDARLLIPSLRRCFISGTSLPAVFWPPMRFSLPSCLIDSRIHPVVLRGHKGTICGLSFH